MPPTSYVEIRLSKNLTRLIKNNDAFKFKVSKPMDLATSADI